MEMIILEDKVFKRIGKNLYKRDYKNYRLFAYGVSPNNCWLINPRMVELIDIDIKTGNDIYGKNVIDFDPCGTIPNCMDYIRLF